jgi:alkylation response protein AidB-like acyl-CoA dehydrogenase
VDFLPDDEQLALARSASDLLSKELPPRRDMATEGYSSRALLRRCAALGWFALGVPEQDGGLGASVVEEALLFREIGRALAPGPFLSTLLGGRVAAAAGDHTTAAGIFTGDVVVGLAERVPASAVSEEGERWRAFDAVDVDLLLVLAPGEARLVRPPAVRPLHGTDELTAIGACDLSAAADVAAAPSPDAVLHDGWVLVSAMLTGIAEATRDMAVAYLKERHQFGRPIGSFQALKHRAADMAVEAEMALSITTYAALSLAEADPNAALSCMSARVLTYRAALANARANIQLHGAMGVTFEHDAHFYMKRTHVLGHQLGGLDVALRAIFDQPSPLDAP